MVETDTGKPQGFPTVLDDGLRRVNLCSKGFVIFGDLTQGSPRGYDGRGKTLATLHSRSSCHVSDSSGTLVLDSCESQSVSKVERRLSWIDLLSPESQSCVHLPATKYCHRRGGAPGKNVTCKQPKPIKLFV